MPVFILNLKSDNIDKVDELFRGLIASEEFNAELSMHIVFKNEKIALYKVKMPASALSVLKKKLEELCSFESFELFEYKDW